MIFSRTFQTRSHRLKAIAVTGLAAALGASLLVASPAQAAKFRPLSEASLSNSSLTLADLPRWIVRTNDPTLEQTYEQNRRATRPDLCLNANGDGVTGPRPKQYMGSMATTRVDLENLGGTEINSDIYQYANRAAAVRAWKRLNAKAMTCAGQVNVDVEAEGVEVLVSVATDVDELPVLFGRPGLALSQEVDVEVIAGELDIAVLGDQYSNYYLAGQSIIRVEFANINGATPGSLSRVARQFVETMAIVVTQRIQLRSQR